MVNRRESFVTKLKTPALVLAGLASLARVTRTFRVDIVHSHWVLPQGFVAAVGAGTGVPTVLTVHGGDVYGLRGRTLDKFSSFALRHASSVTANSSATRAAVSEITDGSVDAEVVPMGVDVRRLPVTDVVARVRQTYRSPDGPLLVFVGRVVEEKGVEEIVRATALLTEHFPGVSVVIGGSGQHLDRVRDLARSLDVGARVHTPGWIEPAEVPSWLQAADVVVAPSKEGPEGWQEGQGLSIIEAMAIGKPVVATRSGGIVDTIEDGVTGLLVAPGDAPALAGAVRRLVDNPNLAEKIGCCASLAAHERFDRFATAQRFDSIYRGLLAARDERADDPSALRRGASR